jgi:hypothetical protein
MEEREMVKAKVRAFVGKVEQYSPLKCEENITNISFDSGLKLE